MRRVGIVGAAASLPERVVTTEELQDQVVSASGLPLRRGVFERATGIRRRRVARPDEQASTLAVRAARSLLRDVPDGPDVDVLIFASASRDRAEPATAHIVQAELGTSAHVFDINNACNSLLNGIDVARALILADRARRVLVVSGETPTRAMRWQPDSVEQAKDSFAGYTFGDGGAALLIEEVTSGGIGRIQTDTFSEYWEVGGIAGAGSQHPRGDEHTYFYGDGAELRDIFEKVARTIVTAFDWGHYAKVLVHQVTLPYLNQFVEAAGVPPEKLVLTLPELGNMASATLGVQLARVFDDLPSGAKVLFVGLGGGISVMTMEWEKA
ncbi:ketoacyl-ACP synthase III [Actinoplanes sp. TBRC 11911]|uniref:3-oxoacyl-ACP synthase III family protein n=1 Tax=Actinoplanes sp. TBRC 11911 TaxID=2729386 RepID=UPI00145D2C0B|nr:3-oxoacyl-[acyl-carrier-protein] synthase III C-terminal domain-containing protein [Actinoplanes sp. TBRC 11911]NMO57730.1 ketoacyl-ACP synthase III [Actinoplanes sp. TBRC 11911]